MGELEDKLASLLSNPAALDKVMGVVRTLSQTGTEKAETASAPIESGPPDLTGLVSTFLSGKSDKQPFSGLDPKITSLLIKLMSTYADQDCRQAALLNALKPYINGRRRENIDRAIEIVRIAKVARQALEGLIGGAAHV